MPTFSTKDIHNVAIVGARVAGKTSLADAMLFAAGAVTRRGSVDDGTSVSDFEAEERNHQHSIYPAILRLDHQGRRVHLIDVPGAPDLIGQTISVLPAVETVLLVIDGSRGVDGTARRLFALARSLDLPLAIVVNKIGRDTDPRHVLSELAAVLGRECLPINLPTAKATEVVDCLLNGRGDSDVGPVAEWHTKILDQVVEVDDTLMERYLGGEDPNYSALHEPFERAMDQGHVVPVCFTEAIAGVGITALLDVIERHFPTPLEGNRRPFVVGQGEGERPFSYEDDASKPLLAHVFRVTTDPHRGKVACFRVYQGRLTGQSQVYIGASKRAVKPAHVFEVQGKELVEVDAIEAGSIGAVAKVDEVHLGDVLHDDHALDFVHHRTLPFPTPLYGLAVTPKTRGDEPKLTQALARLEDEDPTFRFRYNAETGELVMYGLGELHLRLVLERLANRGLEVTTAKPKIAYRETIAARAEGHHRHKKQTGGAGQFGEVFLRVEPLARGAGFEFVDEVRGGVIPNVFIPAIEKGVRAIMETGVVAGFPVQDVRVTVYDGKTHAVDGKEVAFRTAGMLAFRDAFLKAAPKLLEPVVQVEVTVPADSVGSVTGDFASRRGRIAATDVLPNGASVVRATVPAAEMSDYEAALSTMSAGRGTYAMEFSHYDSAPAPVQERLAGEFRPQAEG